MSKIQSILAACGSSKRSRSCAQLYLILISTIIAQAPLVADAALPSNTDESKVPKYTLPDPLVMLDGQQVTDANMWRQQRRPEVLELFRKYVYGRSPARPEAMRFETLSVDNEALGGTATRKEIRILVTGREDGPKIDVLMYLPRAAKKPVPVFLGLNFDGNHTICNDPGVPVSQSWIMNDPRHDVVNNRSREDLRGSDSKAWQVKLLLSRGYGLVTACYGDIEPDNPTGWKTGVRAALSPQGKDTVFKADDWGAISAWAWGLSRIMDYLETDRDIDIKHVAVMGHSRLGKTALWAGAQDERFAITISNDSGCGGAALSRRAFGETVEAINTHFPHWFCANFKKYNAHEDQLPVDQHELVALVAPRPVYVASAEEDVWADPRGEFLSALGADPVYRLLGTDGLAAKEMPLVEHPIASTIGYHIRHGKHAVTAYDWQRYLDFADRHFK